MPSAHRRPSLALRIYRLRSLGKGGVVHPSRSWFTPVHEPRNSTTNTSVADVHSTVQLPGSLG